jgi:ribosomal protein S18
MLPPFANPGHRGSGSLQCFQEGSVSESDYREPRGDYRDRRDRDCDRETGPSSVKSRLRAKARKRDRKMRKRGFGRKKVSRLTTDKTISIDYKDPKLLRSFLSETGKILPRRIT